MKPMCKDCGITHNPHFHSGDTMSKRNSTGSGRTRKETMSQITDKQLKHGKQMADLIRQALPKLTLFDLVSGTNWIMIGCEGGGWDETLEHLDV